MAVEVLASTVVADGGARVGMAGGDLDVAQVNACVEHGRDGGYLYFILKRAWSAAVSASEARGPREDKERSEETLVLVLPYVAQRVADICKARRDQP